MKREVNNYQRAAWNLQGKLSARLSAPLLPLSQANIQLLPLTSLKR
jgi:hypothetical protein